MSLLYVQEISYCDSLYEMGQDFLDSSDKYGYIDLFEEVDDGH